MSQQSQNPLNIEAQQHYLAGMEGQRLADGSGQIELMRTQELLSRFLPPAPVTVLDVGGGTRVYAFWLASQGYRVHLVDAMPLHIEQARQFAKSHPKISLANLETGDARHLNQPPASAEAVLLLGPLYHLTDRADRLAALREAGRVLREDGLVFAVGISRFASLLDGMMSGLLADADFVSIVQNDLQDGQHRNPANHPAYFTTAFFHHPSELPAEVAEAGFKVEQTLAIEGPAWLSDYAAKAWSDATKREELLNLLRLVEAEPSLLGASAHFMVVGRKPA